MLRGNAYAEYNDLGSGGKPERMNMSDFRLTPYVVWRSSEDIHEASLVGLTSGGDFKLTRYINHNLCPYTFKNSQLKVKQGVTFKNYFYQFKGKTVAQGVSLPTTDTGQTYVKQFASVASPVTADMITTPSSKYTVLALNITAEASNGIVAYKYVTNLTLTDSTGHIIINVPNFTIEGVIEAGTVQASTYGIVNLDWANKTGKSFETLHSDGITEIAVNNSVLYLGVQDSSADKDYTVNLYNFGVYALGSNLAQARIDNSVNMVGAFNASTGEISTGGTMKSISQSVDDAYSVSVSGTFAGKDLKVNDIIVFINDVAAGTDVTGNDFTIIESGGLTGS